MDQSPAARSAASSNGVRSAALDAEREAQLQRLLLRMEAGELEPYEYARRVEAVDHAPSADAMASVVDAPAPEEPVLDAVDLALLARATAGTRDPRKARRLSLAVIGVFFVLLLVAGMWLVQHAQSTQQSGGLRPAPAPAAPALPAPAGGLPV